MKKKRFIVRKFIMATSAQEALKVEKRYKADDVWVDEEYMKQNIESHGALGFSKK